MISACDDNRLQETASSTVQRFMCARQASVPDGGMFGALFGAVLAHRTQTVCALRIGGARQEFGSFYCSIPPVHSRCKLDESQYIAMRLVRTDMFEPDSSDCALLLVRMDIKWAGCRLTTRP